MGAKDRDWSLVIFPLTLIFSFYTSKCCCANVIYSITSSQALSQGQTLASPSQIFELGFFTPNNSVNQYVGIWYRGISPQTVVWVANRDTGIRVTNLRPPSLIISSKGNLELLDGNHNSVWSTNIHLPTHSSIAIIIDTGNFVLKEASSGEHLWHSFDHPGYTFLPGSVLSFNAKTGESSDLTSWKDDTDPSVGSFTVGLAQQSPPQIFIWINGSIPHWRSGPWDKSKFIGIQNMDTSYQSPHSIQEDVDKATTYVYFNCYISSIVSKEFISSEGVLKMMIKGKRSDKDWETIWEVPKS